MKTTAGLTATPTAATRPTAGPDSRDPIQYVAQTSRAAQSGLNRYGPHTPATSVAVAIRMGSPGG